MCDTLSHQQIPAKFNISPLSLIISKGQRQLFCWISELCLPDQTLLSFSMRSPHGFQSIIMSNTQGKQLRAWNSFKPRYKLYLWDPVKIFAIVTVSHLAKIFVFQEADFFWSALNDIYKVVPLVSSWHHNSKCRNTLGIQNRTITNM